MPFTINYNSEHGIVESVISGEITGEALSEHAIRKMNIAKQNGARLFLTDANEATLAVSLMDMLNLPKLYTIHYAQRPVKVAVIPPTQKEGKSLVDFYHTVCANRGWETKACKNRQDALDWLLEKDTDR